MGYSPPLVLPAFWETIDVAVDGRAYRNNLASLACIVSAGQELDGRTWIHMSLSHPSRLPTWRELVEAKELFLGDRYAYQVLPPRDKYVNIHPHVLHLFAVDGGEEPLPDFTQGSGSL